MCGHVGGTGSWDATLVTIPVSRMGERNPGSRRPQSRPAPVFSPFIIPAACVLVTSYLLLRTLSGELGVRLGENSPSVSFPCKCSREG